MGEAHKSRIPNIDPERAARKTRRLLGQVRRKLGLVPNFFRVLANAPVALEGYLNFSAALAGGSLDNRIREQIAVAVAESPYAGRHEMRNVCFSESLSGPLSLPMANSAMKFSLAQSPGESHRDEVHDSGQSDYTVWSLVFSEPVAVAPGSRPALR
jgi:hypothetical protein